MKYTWRKKYEFEIGTAMPGDPQIHQYARRTYLRCPLCFDHCPEGYWKHYHSKNLHGQCLICEQWFLLPTGLGQHLSKSRCGFVLLDGLAELDHKQRGDRVIIKLERSKW